jgi:hypothetical protein
MSTRKPPVKEAKQPAKESSQPKLKEKPKELT